MVARFSCYRVWDERDERLLSRMKGDMNEDGRTKKPSRAAAGAPEMGGKEPSDKWYGPCFVGLSSIGTERRWLQCFYFAQSKGIGKLHLLYD